MLAFLATIAWAEAPADLHPGEMYGTLDGWTGNAYTAPEGMVALRPVNRSVFGISEMVDLKASLPGFFLGPHVNVEVSPLETQRVALSLEVGASTGWTFREVGYTAIGHASFRQGDTGMLNLSLGYAAQQQYDGEVALEDTPILRPEIGYDIFLSDFSTLVLTMRTNILGWEEWGPHGAIGGYYTYARGVAGLSVGMNLALLGTGPLFPSEVPEQVMPQLTPTIPLPLPHLQLWVRI